MIGISITNCWQRSACKSLRLQSKKTAKYELWRWLSSLNWKIWIWSFCLLYFQQLHRTTRLRWKGKIKNYRSRMPRQWEHTWRSQDSHGDDFPFRSGRALKEKMNKHKHFDIKLIWGGDRVACHQRDDDDISSINIIQLDLVGIKLQCFMKFHISRLRSKC